MCAGRKFLAIEVDIFVPGVGLPVAVERPGDLDAGGRVVRVGIASGRVPRGVAAEVRAIEG